MIYYYWVAILQSRKHTAIFFSVVGTVCGGMYYSIALRGQRKDPCYRILMRRLKAMNNRNLQEFYDCFSPQDLEVYKITSDDGACEQLFESNVDWARRWKTIFMASPIMRVWTPYRMVLVPVEDCGWNYAMDVEQFQNYRVPIGDALDGSTGIEDIQMGERTVLYGVNDKKIKKIWIREGNPTAEWSHVASVINYAKENIPELPAFYTMVIQQHQTKERYKNLGG